MGGQRLWGTARGLIPAHPRASPLVPCSSPRIPTHPRLIPSHPRLISAHLCSSLLIPAHPHSSPAHPRSSPRCQKFIFWKAKAGAGRLCVAAALGGLSPRLLPCPQVSRAPLGPGGGCAALEASVSRLDPSPACISPSLTRSYSHTLQHAYTLNLDLLAGPCHAHCRNK